MLNKKDSRRLLALIAKHGRLSEIERAEYDRLFEASFQDAPGQGAKGNFSKVNLRRLGELMVQFLFPNIPGFMELMEYLKILHTFRDVVERISPHFS